jgi:hypothetical protein
MLSDVCTAQTNMNSVPELHAASSPTFVGTPTQGERALLTVVSVRNFSILILFPISKVRIQNKDLTLRQYL